LFFLQYAIILANMLTLLYTHDDFLIVNKPPGLAVQGGKRIQTSLIDEIERDFHCKTWLVHRLDQETSSCMLVARSPRAASTLSKLIVSDTVQKTYAVLTTGQFPETCRVLDLPLIIEGKSVSARTIINKVIRIGSYSFLACTLKTGRMHQIRRQCAMSGFPVVGDDKYGNFEANRNFAKTYGVKALFLHSWILSLAKPYAVKVSAPLPEHFTRFFSLSDESLLNELADYEQKDCPHE